MRRSIGALAVVAALAVAPAARANTSINLEVFGGWQDLKAPGSVSNATGTVQNAARGSEGTGLIGADLLFNLGGLGLGVAVDKTVSGNVKPWAGSLLGGFLLDISLVRVELLGELGRTAVAFEDLFASNGATFVGVRPGVNVRLGPSPFRLGLGGIVRWPTSGGDFGSPNYGIVGKLGWEIP